MATGGRVRPWTLVLLDRFSDDQFVSRFVSLIVPQISSSKLEPADFCGFR